MIKINENEFRYLSNEALVVQSNGALNHISKVIIISVASQVSKYA